MEHCNQCLQCGDAKGLEIRSKSKKERSLLPGHMEVKENHIEDDVEMRNPKIHGARRRCSHVRVFIWCLEAGKLLSIGGNVRLCSMEREKRLPRYSRKTMESLHWFGYGL